MPKRPDPTPPPHRRPHRTVVTLLRITLWAVVWGLLLAVAIVTVRGMPPGFFNSGPEYDVFGRQPTTSYLNAQIGWTLVFLGGGSVLLLLAFAAALSVRRRREAVAVLGHLAAAVDLHLPLPAYLRLAAAGEAPSLRRRIVRLATNLEAGQSLGDALAQATPDLPRRVIDRLSAAERVRMLDDALSGLLRHERRQLSRIEKTRPGLGYACVVLGVVLFVMAMIDIFVAPKFAQIFHDFKAPLPPLTRLVFSDVWLWPAVLLMVAVVISALVLLARVLRDLFLLRRGRPLFGGVWDRVVWRLPVFGNLVRARDYAAACEVLDEALRGGRPLPEAIDAATMPSLNLVLRRRMRAWQSAVEIGDATAAAARGAGLPKLLCDLLAAARHDAADAVAFAGRVYAASAQRLAVAIAAVTPLLLTGVLATLVFVVALALFRPYVALIEITQMKVYP